MKCDKTGVECAGNNRFGCFECGVSATLRTQITTNVVSDWIESLGVDDAEMVVELIDCPENGLETFVSEYQHNDMVSGAGE